MTERGLVKAGDATRLQLIRRLAVEHQGRVLDEDGLPKRQGRLVFAFLALERHRSVPRDQVAEALWASKLPGAWEASLSSVVSRLRSALSSIGLPGNEVLRSAGGCYQLHLPAGAVVDVEVASGDVDDAERLLRLGQAPAAASRTTQVLELLRHTFMPGEDAPWIDRARSRLRTLHLRALDVALEAALAQGEAAGPAAEEILSLEPFRESGWRGLMRAQLAEGNSAEALRSYERLRELLANELGADPAPETQALQLEILQGVREVVPAVATHRRRAGQPAPPDEIPGVRREERRVVTVLFADLCGSTVLGERLDEADFKLVVDGAVSRMADAMDSYGGNVMQRRGDGVVVLFGVPDTHEDDPERAIRAGLSMLDSLRSYGEEVARSWDVSPLEVRVAVNTGPVLVSPGEDGYSALGDTMNTASRLESAAQPGTVLVGDSTRRTCEHLFEWGQRHELSLRGKREKVTAWEATKPKPASARRRRLPGAEADLVGRDAELAEAVALLGSLRRGSGGVLFVTGDPGIGKSRLCAELRLAFLQGHQEAGRPIWVEGRCVSYGQSRPYWPFRGLLREWLGTSPDQPELRTRVTLRRELETLFSERADELYPALATVLGVSLEPGAARRLEGLSPEAMQLALLEALRSLFEGLTTLGPVVAVLEDVHWADPSSLRLLELLLPVTEQAALLIVVVGRSEREHPWWGLRDLADRTLPHRTQEIRLEALDESAQRRLLHELVGGGTLPDDVARRVLENAEGNPFFLEELIRSLVDVSALVRTDDGWRYERDAVVEIPETVEKLLLSRIDRLAPEARDVLSAAAVIGRQFSQPVLEAVCGEDVSPAGSLPILQRLDLVREIRRWPQVEYRFKHALTQDAAYRSLTPDRRSELHRRAAEAVEHLLGDEDGDMAGVLARHWEEAGEGERALRFHHVAAERAAALYARGEAIGHFTAALDLAATLRDRVGPELVNDMRLGRAQIWLETGDARGPAEFREILTETQASGDRGREARSLMGLGHCEFLLGEHRARGVQLFRTALGIAEDAGDADVAVQCLNRLAIEFALQADFTAALAHGERARELALAAGDESLEAISMDSLKLIAYYLGDLPTVVEIVDRLEHHLRRRENELWYLQFAIAERALAQAARAQWDEAIARLDEALEREARLKIWNGGSFLITGRAWVDRARGSYGEALRLAREAVSAASSGGVAQWTVWAEANLGALLLEIGSVEEAVEMFDRTQADAERYGIGVQEIRCAAYGAWAGWLAGDRDRAQQKLGEAEALFGRVSCPPGQTFLYAGDAYLATARVHLALGDVERAEGIAGPILTRAADVGWHELIGLAALVLGWCRLAGGAVDEAHDLFRRALRAATDGGLPPVRWRAHAAIAHAARAAGSLEDAGEERARARAIVERLADGLDDRDARDRLLRSAEAEIMEDLAH